MESTEADRLERLRGLFSGSRAKEGVGRALGQGAFGNVLVGALLHGADRVRQGHEPTDLEKLVMDAVGTVLSEEELKAWGGVYRDAAEAGGTLAVVPQTFASRSADQGYSIEDLRGDLPQIIVDTMAAPNVQIVDPRAADRHEDTPEFLAAMRESKLAVTAFGVPGETFAIDDSPQDGAAQTPGDEGVDGGVVQSYGVKLEAESFYVERTVGDQWGTDDEIFRTASGQSDPALPPRAYGRRQQLPLPPTRPPHPNTGPGRRADRQPPAVTARLSAAPHSRPALATADTRTAASPGPSTRTAPQRSPMPGLRPPPRHRHRTLLRTVVTDMQIRMKRCARNGHRRPDRGL
ncbi:hypothetical protein [Streptomyces sp. SPB4]|uniref:hypothetical protein n=1 Tax=Streptomyces sp. SPB4 TaxID=2940553 RepID=UPI00247539AC|nr:hypothetical protein [Streptomyces sp. SPB4]